MAESRFNINEAFKEVFGIYGRTPLFTPPKKESSTTLPKYSEIETKEADIEFSKNLVAPMTGVLLQDRFGVSFPSKKVGVYGKVSYDLPVETVLDLDRAKIIVKTNMQGRDGSVKEYISMDDWNLTFKGFIINYENDLYPEKEVETLVKIFELNNALTMHSKWLSRWGIERIVVTDISLPTFEGVSNVQPYEITCLSDTLIVLEIQ